MVGCYTDFLTYYTFPRVRSTGALLDWGKLPVVDKLWRAGNARKGGFIQEFTGWKPSIYQPTVDVRQLWVLAGARDAAAARLP